MDDLHPLPIVDYCSADLAPDLPDVIYSYGARTFRSGWQRTGSIYENDWRDRLHRLHHHRHNGMDVAKHCALGCGLRAASGANARHTRIKLALPHLEICLSA